MLKNRPEVKKDFWRLTDDTILGCLDQECETEIMPIDAKSSTDQYQVIEACVDSGAVETVAPNGLWKGSALKPSEGPRSGKHVCFSDVAQDAKLGERNVAFRARAGQYLKTMVH